MTDGHTGIQVAPITEDDMSKVYNILKRASDAIVGMSQLQQDVQALTQTVDTLKSDLSRYQSQVAALDEALSHVRGERDAAQAEAKRQTDRANTAEAEIASLRFANDNLNDQVNRLSAELIQVKKDRDDWSALAEDNDQKLKEAQASLDKIKDVHASIFGASAPAMPSPPAPEPVPVPPVQATAEYHWPSEPSPTHVEPVAPSVEDTSLDWKPGYSWDHLKQLYVKTA